jgi:hypothetical protein
MNWKASPSYMSQGRHCGYYWHLMAHAKPSRISRAGLLCRSLSAWLSALSSSPLLCGPQWLLWAHISLPPAATPQPPGWSRSEGHMEGGLGNKCKDHSALGKPALSWGTKPTVGRRTFCLLPAHQLSSKVKTYTNMCVFLQLPPKTETTSKNGLEQRPSDRTRPGHF